MKALGLNAITTYVAWNCHEVEEMKYERLDEVTQFLDIAHEEGMLVNLRLGPYMCAEWDLGGLPTYLLTKSNIKLRTFNADYITAVDRWWNTLLPKLVPYLYSAGGPIVLAQVENEYGSFGNVAENPDDAHYMDHLLKRLQNYFGDDVVYTTVDAASLLPRGTPWKNDTRVLATIDGGLSSTGYDDGFAQQKAFNAEGHFAKMWSELYTGWLTHWGEVAVNKTAKETFDGLKAMVESGGSFSLYMAHGGTNFGFWSGANSQGEANYAPDLTSYDYNAPISEAGDHNIGKDGGDLFAAVASALATNSGNRAPEPAPIKKRAYGVVKLSSSVALFEALFEGLPSCKRNLSSKERFPSMESLGMKSGLVLYHGYGPYNEFALDFTYTNLHDRVQVFADEVEVGTAYRSQCPTTVQVPHGYNIDLLVENMGHINYGQGIYDWKGLNMTPPDPSEITWFAYCFDLNIKRIQGLTWHDIYPQHGPIFYRAVFNIDGTPADTFVDTRGLTKGYLWVNGYNLGRFWEAEGPQHTLYVPATFLHEGENEVIILDLHGAQVDEIHFVDRPRYGGSGPSEPTYVLV